MTLHRAAAAALGGAVVLLSGWPNIASATLLNNGTGLASPDATITFSEVAVAQNAAVTNQFAALGASFTGLFMDPCVANSGNFFPNMSGRTLGNFAVCQPPPGEAPFSILFSEDVSEAAFVLIGNAGFPELTALLDGNVVESGLGPSVSISGQTNWYGFTGIVFDEIQVDPAVFQNFSTVRIDNLQFVAAPADTGGGEAPEPATIALLAVGLAGLRWLRRA